MPQASADVIDVRDYQLRLRIAGEGAPLMCLGDAFGPQLWSPTLDLLAKGHRVLQPEHPGFGGQPAPDWLDTVSDLANFHLDLLDRLDLRQVHLVGFGIGGWIAADLAMRNAARLASLTLVAPAGLHVRELPMPDIFLCSEEQAMRACFHDEAVAASYANVCLTPETEDQRLQNNEVTARISWEPRLHDPHLMKWLHRIKLPVAVIWGAQDDVIPAAYAQEWQRRIPQARVDILDACGHCPQFEKPDALAALIQRHIAGAGR